MRTPTRIVTRALARPTVTRTRTRWLRLIRRFMRTRTRTGPRAVRVARARLPTSLTLLVTPGAVRQLVSRARRRVRERRPRHTSGDPIVLLRRSPGP